MNKVNQQEKVERTVKDIQREISKLGFPNRGSRKMLRQEELRHELRRVREQESKEAGERTQNPFQAGDKATVMHGYQTAFLAMNHGKTFDVLSVDGFNVTIRFAGGSKTLPHENFKP